MPLEDIAEGAARLLGRVLFEIVFELFYEIVGYYVGLGVLRVLTFGSYPPKTPTERQATMCKILGILTVVGTIGFAFYHLNNS